MKKNRLMTLALITALAISAFPSNAVKLNESSADAELDFEIPESRVNGYRMVPVPERDKYRSMADDPDYDPDRALSGPDDLNAVSLSEAQEALPKSFPASYNDVGLDGVLEALNEKMPQTRDQGDYGVCWSFSTTAALEGNLINKYGYNPETTDLSELHTAYYGMHYSLDNGNGNCDITEYDTTCFPGNIPYYDAGNDTILASDFLSNRTGAVNETDMPYSGIEDTLKGKLDAPQDRCLVTVKGWQLLLTRDKSQWPMIKAAIKENGAVMSGIPAVTKLEQINLETDSYYTDQVRPNHAIAIVGWDDDYSYKNFRLEENGGTISENGAWIIRNSWYDGSKMHPYSYFYMSYYTPCFLGEFINVVSLSACPLGDDYDNIYQYDGMVSSIEGVISDSSNRLLASNVFTARGREDLKAVSFKTDLDVCNMDYTVKVYTGLKEGYDSPIPEGAAPVATAKGKTTVPGLYRVNLDNAVELKAGDIYSVVVTVTKTDDVVGIGAETKDSTVPRYVNKNMAVSPGQSFLYDNDKGEWIDMGDGYKAVYYDQEMT
ncbi:MAG: hypothetical protein K6E33_09100, partial [Lachnospiraceae bacterium]|nr:hypothetical protein [Lachnospiraceae bacterium]